MEQLKKLAEILEEISESKNNEYIFSIVFLGELWQWYMAKSISILNSLGYVATWEKYYIDDVLMGRTVKWSKVE